MKRHFLLFVAMVMAISSWAQKVAMLRLNTPSQLEQTAISWFQSVVKGDVLTLSQLANGELTVAQYEALWVMVDRVGMAVGDNNLPDGLRQQAINVLKPYVQAGGNLLLTGQATQLVYTIGRCPYAPKLYSIGEESQNPDVWGIQAVIGDKEGQIYDNRSHDIFKGLESNDAYGHPTFALIGDGFKYNHNCMWDLNLADYGLTDNPDKVRDFEDKVNAFVLGTWQHVTDYCCAGIVEFSPTTGYQGTVLACGLAAFDWGQADYHPNFKKFSKNMVEYLSPKATSVRSVRTADQEAAVCFDLQGRKISQPAKGLYIQNGKKLMK